MTRLPKHFPTRSLLESARQQLPIASEGWTEYPAARSAKVQTEAITSTQLVGTDLHITVGERSYTIGGLMLNPGRPIRQAADTNLLANTSPKTGMVVAASLALGTEVLTQEGYIPIEYLSPTDRVVTMRGFEKTLTRVYGIVRQVVSGHDPVGPIRILANALADNVPRRDLLVSPECCIFVEGTVLPIRMLLNEATIRHDPCVIKAYICPVIQEAALVVAEGVELGLFVPESISNPLLSEHHNNSVVSVAVPPSFSAQTDDEMLKRTWTRLANRARLLGHIVRQPLVTNQANLHLMFDKGNQALPARPPVDGRHEFLVPKGKRRITIASRSVIPSELYPYLKSDRRIGVAISRIVLWGRKKIDLYPDDFGEDAGWWERESIDGIACRWTNGHAMLTLPPIQCQVIEFFILATTNYFEP